MKQMQDSTEFCLRMEKRSELSQKVLDDLRQRKQACTSNHRQRANTSSPESNGSSRRSYQGSAEISTSRRKTAGYDPRTSKSTSSLQTTGKSSNNGRLGISVPEISPTEVVPFERARRSELVDLSMAIAIALNNYGSQVKLECHGTGVGNSGLVTRRRSVELQGTNNKYIPNGNPFLTGQLPYLSDLQIRQISSGAHNLDMILKAYSDGLFLDRDTIQMNKKLVKGANNFEDSLKPLSTLRETSESTVQSQRKQVQIKLLKENEKDEALDFEHEESITLRKPSHFFGSILRFFVGDSKENRRKNKHEKKQIALSYPAQRKSHLPNLENSSSDVPTKSVSHKWFAGSSSDLNNCHASPNTKNQIYVNGEVKQSLNSKATLEYKVSNNGRVSENKMSLQGNSERENVRVPNVIIKLMGLEEIAPLKMKSKENDSKYSSLQIKSRIKENSVSLSDTFASGNQQKQKQEREGGKFCSYDVITSSKGKESLYNPTRDEKRNTVIMNSKKLKLLTRKQTELLSNKQLKEAGLTKEDHGRRQNTKEKEKVLKQRDTRESYCGYNLKNTLQQPYEIKNGKDNRKELQNREGKSSLISNQQSKVAKHNQPLGATQRPSPDVTVDREANRIKSIAKNRKTANQEMKSSFLDINPITYTNYAANSIRNEASIEEIATSGCFFAGNLDKKKQKESQGKEIIKGSGNATSIDAHKIPQDKFIEIRRLKTDYRSAKRRIPSFTKPSKVTCPVQIHVLGKEIKDSKTEAVETELPIPKQTNSLLQDLEEIEYEGKHKTGGMEPSLTVEPKLKKETKTALTSPMVEEIKLVPRTVITIKDKANKDETSKKELHVRDLAGRRSEDYTDDDNEQNRQPEAIRKEQLAEDENHLMEMLIGNQKFLNAVGAFLGLDIPLTTNQGGKQARQQCEDKLALDFGYESVRRKGKLERMMFVSPTKYPSPTCFKTVTLKNLVRELNREIESLKFFKFEKENGYCDLTVTVEYLQKLVENDVESARPSVNCMWDLGWNCRIFATQELELVIEDIEKLVFRTLLDDVLMELL